MGGSKIKFQSLPKRRKSGKFVRPSHNGAVNAQRVSHDGECDMNYVVTTQNLPVFLNALKRDDPHRDCHFWVEKDGLIVDPYFPEYDVIKQVKNLVGKRIYKPQTDFSIILPQIKEQMFLIKELGWTAEKYQTDDYTPSFGLNPVNALNNKHIHGGKIVVGSMGWKLRNSSQICWEYG
tara:strand:- start:400 stop:933 length:534 start_codon:yes stop_codon:yes gene_type:complete